ncbi:hypothetical protein ZYGR_0AD05520 [Zygosaccharomyces rouxii]|uniref:Uncharacterized protein n=1 Tax=Zygosaccharomyces rouxii TaxID=4956 RepID=A0A1Q3A6M2_ZYGRO|nr:hypothetical protein ZYGR_0AD05520 [Zygosaccharomyces rouxii]
MNGPLSLSTSMDEDSSISTVDLTQKINPSDFKLSIERGKHLIAPFEVESQNYECQCESCHRTEERRPLLPRLCIMGVVCPLLWFYEITLCLYLQWLVPHEPTHPPIDSDQLPTEYELENCKKRTEIGIDPLTLQDIKTTNQPIKSCSRFPYQTSDSPEPEVTYEGKICQEDQLKRAQFLFVRQIATQVIDTHRQQRSYLQKWFWYCTAAIASYVLVLTVILATTIKGSKHSR